MIDPFLVKKTNKTYDAIVVGSGISGGWAAKELCERGLRVLLVERGPAVRHRADYTGESKPPWQLEHSGQVDYTTVQEQYRCLLYTSDAADDDRIVWMGVGGG